MSEQQNMTRIAQQPAPERIDTALACLVGVVQLLGFPADFEQLRRAYVFRKEGMDAANLIRAARDLGLKARQALVIPSHSEMQRLPFPVIVILNNGNYVVLIRSDGDRLVVSDPYHNHGQPFLVPIEKFLEIWSGDVIFVARRFSIKKTLERRFNLSWFVPVILQYKKFFGQVLFLSFLLQFFGLISPMFTQVIIDRVLVHRSLNTLDIFVGAMVVVMFFQIWIASLRSYIFTHTTNKIDVSLSLKLFRHITSLPIRYFETWQVGDIVSRVRELENIRQFITGSSLTVVLDVVFAVVYVAAMFFYSVNLTLVVLSIMPVFIILSLVVTPIFKRVLNERFLVSTANQSLLIETITGIQTVKSMSLERHFIQKWEETLAMLAKKIFSSTNLANIAGNIGSFVQQMFTLTILWFGSHVVIEGKMSVGELIAFQMLAGQIIAPIIRLINMWQYFQQTMVSVERVGDILNDSAEPAFNPNRTTLPKICGEITLDRVTFRYRPDASEVLHQMSLHIQPGMKVGIVGRSGSGKSTLTKLIQRMYVAESGRILVDGVDIAQVEPAWLRRQIGVVLQENYLFSGSIADNIAIAKTGASMEEIVRAATIAGAHEFINELPEQYATAVGERGTSLSGGQRQRIAIARALLTNPSILIFDEATSALDYESERIIMNNLDEMSKGRTMIMIAHRLSTVRRADMIVVLERGKIVECGNHEQLIDMKGYYYELNQLQEN